MSADATSQAKDFPKLFNRVNTPFDVAVCVNAMTDSNMVSSDATDHVYRIVTVKRSPQLDVPAMCRILFLKLMAGLVMCGKPDQLRVEWESQPYYDEEADCLACSLLVLGHPAFLERWEDAVTEAADIRRYLASAEVVDHGLRSLVVPGDPEAHAHEFVTPLPLSTVRALFVSVMLALYDAGDLGDIELAWRAEPTARFEKNTRGRELWVGKATTVITSKARVIVAGEA